MSDHTQGFAYEMHGSGPDLLLFHGGTGSRNHWVRNIDALAQHFRVFALDLPGYGKSPDVPEKSSAEDYLALVHAAVDHLPLADGSFSLVGFSFGGATAAALAPRLGDRLKKLSLIGPAGFGIPSGRSLPMRSRKETDGSAAALKEIMRHNLGVLMLHAPEAITDDVIASHEANILHSRFDSHTLSWQPILLANLAKLTCPVQIMWGEFDRAAYPSVQDRLGLCRDALPEARLQVIGDAGHWAQFEQADEVNRALVDFLR